MIRCALIKPSDIERIIDLLTEGFTRERGYWVNALSKMSERLPPSDLPQYGYALESDGIIVGVLLIIAAVIMVNGQEQVRCNVSSWYVQPKFRAFASVLAMRATRRTDITYYNISPAPHTWRILEAQGYKSFNAGRIVTIPALAPRIQGTQVDQVTSDIRAGGDLLQSELNLLLDHQGYGCTSVICTRQDERNPFVFRVRKRYGLLPFAYLIYCRDMTDFIRFAGPLGRFLARHGAPLVVIDSDQVRLPPLIGKFYDGRPRYVKGPNPPRAGDLAYSELAIFG